MRLLWLRLIRGITRLLVPSLRFQSKSYFPILKSQTRQLNNPSQTSDGQCLFVDPISGDFRENLTPIQIKPCDGSEGQKWDFITAGKHNNKPGFALIVSSLVIFLPSRTSRYIYLLPCRLTHVSISTTDERQATKCFSSPAVVVRMGRVRSTTHSCSRSTMARGHWPSPRRTPKAQFVSPQSTAYLTVLLARELLLLKAIR